MKKKILWMLPVLILAALLLLVYETRSSFTLKTEGNGIAVTANNVIENSAGRSASHAADFRDTWQR